MQPAPAGSLLHVLQQVPDPRGRQGRRHPLVAMLATTVCAMLCGARSYPGIADWIHAQPPEFWYCLGFTRTPPQLGAFRKLLMKLSPQALEDALRPWVDQLLVQQARVGDACLQPLAIDGKSLRGTMAAHQRAIHLLSLLDQRTGFTLAQSEVDCKTNEHKAALTLLKSLVLTGRVITGDAMFCQRDLCRQIVDDDGHYFFEVKGNQPELKKSIAAEFEPAFSPLHREATSHLSLPSRNVQQRPRSPRASVLGSFNAFGRAS